MGPIFHFDSHDDMNDIIHNRGIHDKKLEQIIWDIGAAVTGYVWKSHKKHDIFWFYPEWINIPFFEFAKTFCFISFYN